MRIVHYTLGLYPHRTGGLNRYATDLMWEQSKNHMVSVLLPGGWKPWSKRISIKNHGLQDNIRTYQLCNAMPLPLLYGIRRPQDFLTKPIDRNSFERFYGIEKPDVLHLHTMMGLSEDCLEFFRDKGVKIVYTSHDYFGICPKVNLINQEGVLCEGPEPQKCAACNANAPSTFYLRLRNSRIAFITRDITRWLKRTLNF